MAPIMKPRRSAWATAEARAAFFDGLGGTLCGFASFFAAGAGFGGCRRGRLGGDLLGLLGSGLTQRLGEVAWVGHLLKRRERSRCGGLGRSRPCGGLGGGGLRGSSGGRGRGAPPRAAASFSLSVIGRPSGAAGAAGAGAAGAASSAAAASAGSTGAAGGAGAALALAGAAGAGAPPARAAASFSLSVIGRPSGAAAGARPAGLPARAPTPPASALTGAACGLLRGGGRSGLAPASPDPPSAPSPGCLSHSGAQPSLKNPVLSEEPQLPAPGQIRAPCGGSQHRDRLRTFSTNAKSVPSSESDRSAPQVQHLPIVTVIKRHPRAGVIPDLENIPSERSQSRERGHRAGSGTVGASAGPTW